MDDIIFSVAWECSDRDCKAQWHKASYWITGDGYSVDSYGDGDHDLIDESDLPPQEEVARSWKEYAAYVAKTGSDPLEEYYVARSTETRERWQFRFNVSIIGPVLLEARRAGRKVLATKLPEHVKRYLNLDKGARKLGDFADWAALEAAVPGVKPRQWQTFQIEHDKPRDPAVVARELKQAARRNV